MDPSPHVDIDHLARLARIQLSEAEKSQFQQQLDEILGYFQQLQAAPVEGVEPMAHPFEAKGPLRPDTPAAPWNPEHLLRNAPASRDDQVVVPKVVDDA
jgi:aspartyl-tRNA(Asn)/glutamyl-tRNA(Gln) amidotransferase subunit C